MDKKEEVKRKITKYCELYGIDLPQDWSFEEVSKVSDLINKAVKTHCPFCGKFNGKGFSSVMCECEVAKFRNID